MDNYEDILAELRRKYEADEAARREFQKKHGHIRRPTGVLMDGKIWMAFDGAIYCQEQDGPYNFVNAIHDHALHFFGAEFLDREDQKDLGERHPAIRWLHLHLQAGTTRQNGNGAAWFRFAYDLFTIRDNARLERDLKKRLLNNLTFRWRAWIPPKCHPSGRFARWDSAKSS